MGDSLDTTLNLFSSPVFVLIGLLIGLASLIAGIIPFIRKSQHSLVYRVVEEDFMPDLSGLNNDFVVFYGGIEVRSLTKARIYFWNSGRRSLNFEDLSKQNPLRVALKDGRCLSCDLIASNDKAKALKVLRSLKDFTNLSEDNCIDMIVFEFLNPEEGGIIEVFYHKDHDAEPEITGALRNGKLIRLPSDQPNQKPLTKYFFINFYIYIIGIIVGLVPFFIFLFDGNNNTTKQIFLSISIFISPVGLFLAWYSLKHQNIINIAPKKLISKVHAKK